MVVNNEPRVSVNHLPDLFDDHIHAFFVKMTYLEVRENYLGDLKALALDRRAAECQTKEF